MSEITSEDLKVYKMDDDQRLLYKAGVIDEECHPTPIGLKLLQTVTLEANKTALIELVNNINASKTPKEDEDE